MEMLNVALMDVIPIAVKQEAYTHQVILNLM